MNETHSPIADRHCSALLNMLAFLGFCLIALNLTAASAADVATPQDEAVDAGLFEAIDSGQIEVKFIPIDTTNANVIVKNLTDKPMQIRLPSSFAGVPVLAQMMGGGMGGMGGGMGGMGGGMGGMGGGQAMGGGMGGGMGGMGGGMGGMGGGMGGMGGMMRVAPEKTRKMSVATVCLEHGKPDPNPRMAYKIVPLEEVSKDPSVKLLCEALGNSLVTQNSAQAAAWHLMDKMSWQELAAKNRSESRYTGNVRWFSPLELKTAMMVVSEVKRMAEKDANAYENDYENDYDVDAKDAG